MQKKLLTLLAVWASVTFLVGCVSNQTEAPTEDTTAVPVAEEIPAPVAPILPDITTTVPAETTTVAETPIVPEVKSDCDVTTAPRIKITFPNGWKTFTPGQQLTITWKSCNVTQQVGITLSGFPVPSSTQYFVGNWVNGSVGSQVITIPSEAQAWNYTINISTPPESNPGAEDWSDAPFLIQ